MKKTIVTKLTLISSEGKTTVPAKIHYDDDENIVDPISEIEIVYNGIEYKGKGKDYLWADTFADLQKKLPPDVKLACCMTCRHGNMCPYGNKENQLFCMKDIMTGNMEDVCDVFDRNRNDVYGKCEVFSYGYCDCFVCQSDDFYTYNDFWFINR